MHDNLFKFLLIIEVFSPSEIGSGLPRTMLLSAVFSYILSKGGGGRGTNSN